MSERVGQGVSPIFDEDADRRLIGFRDSRGRNWMIPTWLADEAGNTNAFSGPRGERVQSVNVALLGAVGDNVVDDYPAFARAIALLAPTGGAVLVPDPPVGYRIGTATLTLPTGVVLVGATRHGTRLVHAFNGDMFVMGERSGIVNMRIDGEGATFTGRCMVYTGTNGRQVVSGVLADDWDGHVQWYETAAGSQSTTHDCRLSRRNAGPGTGRFAIGVDPAQQLSAVPRKYSAIETSGQCSFSFGGCNNFFVTNSFVGEIAWGAESRGVCMNAVRLGGPNPMSIFGFNHALAACNFGQQVTIGAGASRVALEGNTYNVVPVVDASGFRTNIITHEPVSYTAALTSGGTQPVLGNGTLTASFASAGSIVFVTIELTIGSTTTLGTGDLRFSLPGARPNLNPIVQYPGVALMTGGATSYTSVVQLPAGTQWVRLMRDTSGPVAFNTPATWATGDIFRITFAYSV